MVGSVLLKGRNHHDNSFVICIARADSHNNLDILFFFLFLFFFFLFLFFFFLFLFFFFFFLFFLPVLVFTNGDSRAPFLYGRRPANDFFLTLFAFIGCLWRHVAARKDAANFACLTCSVDV
jgi:hypothetical protein